MTTLTGSTAELTALLTRLRRRAVRLGASASDAEDMAQDALLRLMQRMTNAAVERPEHYAMTILHNIARARWRGRIELTELEDDSASTLPVGTSRLVLAALCDNIAALPPEQSQIMQLVLNGEFSPNAIAAQLDLPLGTVMSRLARARARLRAQSGLDHARRSRSCS